MAEQTPAATPPGWYPDPKLAGTQRYWDGQRWTDNVAPLAPAPVVMSPPRDDRGMESAGWACAFLLPIVGVVVGIILASRGNSKGIGILVVSVVVMVVAYQIIVSQSDAYY